MKRRYIIASIATLIIILAFAYDLYYGKSMYGITLTFVFGIIQLIFELIGKLKARNQKKSKS